MDVLFDLLLTNKEDLWDDAKVKSSLGCSGHETGVEFKVMKGVQHTAELQLWNLEGQISSSLRA